MTDLDALKDVIGQSTELWNKGRSEEALRLLDSLATRAKQDGEKKSVVILSRHAAVIAESTGNLTAARRYCEEILAEVPEDALTLYTLADVLFRQGANDLAKQNAAKSYSLVVGSASKEAKGLREMLTKRWPEIERWQA
jgi:tetratricopeptide (TPR) repeat protein